MTTIARWTVLVSVMGVCKPTFMSNERKIVIYFNINELYEIANRDI